MVTDISRQLLEEERWSVSVVCEISRWIHEGTDKVDCRVCPRNELCDKKQCPVVNGKTDTSN